MEPSSLSSVILLRLLSSPVRTQLMIPLWGPGAPYPQNGVPSPRIRAYSLPLVQNTINSNHTRPLLIFVGQYLLCVHKLDVPAIGNPFCEDIICMRIAFSTKRSSLTTSYWQIEGYIVCFVIVYTVSCMDLTSTLILSKQYY